MQSIIENGYIAKPYIGVSVDDVSEETQSYGLPQGAAVKSVTQDSPAEEAGLQVNDIITKAGDTEISGSKDLVDVVGAASVGDQLVLTVYRARANHRGDGYRRGRGAVRFGRGGERHAAESEQPGRIPVGIRRIWKLTEMSSGNYW